MKNTDNNKFYLGLDIGTDSIGYAVTDTIYTPLKHRGEQMLGVHTFAASEASADRRTARSGRRLVQRKRQRIHLLQEIFSKEISKYDKSFFIRLKESSLYKEDKNPILDTSNTIFADYNYTDKDYHKQFPTIHHLIHTLMTDKKPYDVRLVYLACSYLISHRGHFFSEVDKANVNDVLDFNAVYTNFENFFIQNDITMPWDGNNSDIGSILKSKKNISTKEKELYALLFDDKKPKSPEEYPYDIASIIKLLCGGETKAEALYKNDIYKEVDKICLNKNDEDLDKIFSDLGDDAELLILLKSLYDWSILNGIVDGFSSVSEAKIHIYEQHKKDLNDLKDIIKKYAPEKYNDIFRYSDSTPNYVAYSGNFKWVNPVKATLNKAKCEDFLKYIKGILSKIKVNDTDKALYDSILDKIDRETFLPKQVTTDNRVIPYQLYYAELTQILNNVSSYLPFLLEKDENGYLVKDKIISIFEFRIPYFVGPLRKDNSKYAWIERKAEGKIYPWNFKELVDYDKSEQAFIDRMTNTCTYLAGEAVLPKNSLLYSKYMVLNEINNIRINEKPIDVATKQDIYNLFLKQKTVTPKSIKKHLEAIGKMKSDNTIDGINVTVKASLLSYHSFKKLLSERILSEQDVENIIERMAYTEEKKRLYKWLSQSYPTLSDNDRKYISSLNLKGFGRLSKKFLSEIMGANKNTGETSTIIDALWETNDNLMKLLSNNYTYIDEIERLSAEYYTQNPSTLEKRLAEMYIPNSVKRPIYRTLDIIKDIKKIKGAPAKIFIEMARDFQNDKKGKRTKSRRDQIKAFYRNLPASEVKELLLQLEDMTDRQLQSERLYLYFIQQGKCMYSGETIDINNLMGTTYDVDHIYPRCFVKDDSLTNKALVLSDLNGKKSDSFPIAESIRTKMTPYWNYLLKNDMISKEKYNRLIRSTPFTEDERWGFINRQLVETRQSSKAVATLLGEIFPDTKIVYVKAGLVSEFRQAFDLIKSRSINDLHHAKDAYLNIVAGDVYNSYFSRKNSDFNMKNYTIKAHSFFGYPKSVNNRIIWKGQTDIAQIKKIMDNNHIHYTNYSYCQKGILFDLQPVKAGKNDNLVPRKKGLDPARYGGYNRTKATFFCLVKYEFDKVSAKSITNESDIIFMPVELMIADRFIADESFAAEYAKNTISSIISKEVTTVSFPLDREKIKIRTVLSFDGLNAFLRGKSSGGKELLFSSMNSFYTDSKTERYIKRIDAFMEKYKTNKDIDINAKYDKITKDENLALYNLYCEKLSKKPFITCFKSYYDTLAAKKEAFENLTIKDQIICLSNIILLLKTGRAGTVDLSLIGESKNYGAFTMNSKISSLAKKYKDIRIIDISASGLYVKKSENLCDLL